jgi:hypothetical protein
MHLRSLVSAIVFGLVLVPPDYGWCAGRADLDGAFLATFGQRAPLVRTWQQPIYDTSEPPKLVETRSVVLDVRPEHLVPLGGGKYALISYETDRSGAHSVSGEIAISYLERTATHWKLDQLWPELLYSGVSGQPANVGVEVHRFGGDPLFMARSAWCGMGECSEWIGVIRFSQSRPVAYGDVLAGATSPVRGSPVHSFQGNTCQNYDVRARIKPPRRSGSLFSIRYDGWTSPPGTLFPKTPLHLLTSYVPDGGKLVMQPVVPVPTCGR